MKPRAPRSAPSADRGAPGSRIRSLHVDTARTWRGGQNQVLLTVTGLESLGYPAVLVAHASGELKRRAGEGLRFVGLEPRSEVDVGAGWQLAKVVKDMAPDVIHAHDPMGVALAAMALQMSAVTPTPKLIASRRVDFHLKRHAFSRWKYRRVAGFITSSDIIRDMLIDDGIPADRIVTVYEGVNLTLIDRHPLIDAHAEFWLPHGAPLIGNVAALAPHKGQKHLVAAAAKVIARVPDARFLILGEGALREALERQVKDLGLERHVFLTGFRTDVLGIMKSFDVFVMSSVTEGLGGAVLEAMACRLPVVGTRAGGIQESVIDDHTGLLVPPRDADALADAIVTLLQDPDRRARFAAAGRTRVEEEFSVEKMVRQTVAVYERFLGRQ